MAVAMDLEIHPHRKPAAERKPKKALGCRSGLRQPEEPKPTPAAAIKIFRCSQQGHQASECLALAPVPQARTPAVVRSKKLAEKGKFAWQAVEVSPPLTGSEETGC